MIDAGKHTGAFTVIELLCVLALLALVVAAAVPVLADTAPTRNLEIAARGLASDMRLAQQIAITTGKTTRLQFWINADEYRMFLPEDEEKVLLPEGISYLGTNFPLVDGVPELRFLRTGAPNRGGRVSLKNGRGEHLYIIVAPATGRVRISPEPPDS